MRRNHLMRIHYFCCCHSLRFLRLLYLTLSVTLQNIHSRIFLPEKYGIVLLYCRYSWPNYFWLHLVQYIINFLFRVVVLESSFVLLTMASNRSSDPIVSNVFTRLGVWMFFFMPLQYKSNIFQYWMQYWPQWLG